MISNLQLIGLLLLLLPLRAFSLHVLCTNSTPQFFAGVHTHGQ